MNNLWSYQQFKLDRPCRQYIIINTHKGLFQFTCLPYGVSSVPGIFQKIIENRLKNSPGVVVYIDDVIITDPHKESRLSALEEVLKCMESNGLWLNIDKYNFMASEVCSLAIRSTLKDSIPYLRKSMQWKSSQSPGCHRTESLSWTPYVLWTFPF